MMLSDSAQRRVVLKAFGMGAGVGAISALGVATLAERKSERKTAQVSVSLLDDGIQTLPHAVEIQVERWRSAEDIRVVQTSSAPTTQTIEPRQDTLVLDNLDVLDGVRVESIHGGWRTTIEEHVILESEDGEPVLTELGRNGGTDLDRNE